MAKLDLLVDVNVNGANKINSLGKSIAGGAIQVAKFALPVAGAIAGVTALAAEAEKSSVKLDAAFKNMGKTSGKTLEQLKTQATELGEATTFDDEGIMEAQATLLSFGAVSGKAFDRTIQGAADLAAATGKDLPAATTLLAKALADPAAAAGKLSKAGVVLTEQQEDQIKALTEAGKSAEAQEVILGALEERYTGVNKALSESSAGQAAQALEDLENAGEDLGAIFLPILAALAQGVSAFAHFVQENMGTIRPIIEGIGEVIGTVFGAISSVISGFVSGGSGDAFAGVFRAIGQIVDFVSKNVFPFLLEMFNRVVTFIKENGPTIGSIVSQAFGAIVNVAKVVVPILMNIARVVFPIILTAAGILLKGLDGTFKLIGGVFEVAGKVVDTMVKGITGAWQLLSTVTTAIWTGITGTIKGVINTVIDILNGFFGFLNGFQIGLPAIPNPLGGFLFEGATIDPFNIPLIPHLAQGGIISSPTLALLGEAGPEAVIPLSNGRGPVTEFHSHIEVKGEDPFIRNEDDLVRVQQRVAFLAGF
jgi:phage-related protein